MNTFKTLTSLALLVSTRFALVQAAIYVTNPVASTVCTGGQSCEIDWVDDGQSPLLSSIGECSVGLYNGEMVLAQSLTSVDVSSTTSLSFTPNPSAGADGAYYLVFTSNGIDYQAWSATFTLNGMTGSTGGSGSGNSTSAGLSTTAGSSTLSGSSTTGSIPVSSTTGTESGTTPSSTGTESGASSLSSGTTLTTSGTISATTPSTTITSSETSTVTTPSSTSSASSTHSTTTTGTSTASTPSSTPSGAAIRAGTSASLAGGLVLALAGAIIF
ncbi:hypothetical protein M405DRAFT_824648 [Rhizopogon salebrosus TDB-379]|nr:hypothetical protein M405DRAFT_824648 [Rhizopogon salebrosus TDB-379]